MESVYLTSVRAYHDRNGHLVNLVQQNMIADGVRVQRARLILEEVGELTSAYHDRNLVEIADGLADLLYVIMGTAVVYGIIVTEEYMKTMENVWRPAKSPNVPEWKIGLDAIGKITIHASSVVVAMSINIVPIKSLHDLIEATFAFACACGVPLDRVFAEVHRSNMTKNLVKTDGVAKYGADVNAHIKGPGYEPPRIKEILGITGGAGAGASSTNA